MKKELVTAKTNAPVLYDKMKAAIAACHSVDDCRKLSEQASAIAAYYKQLKDDSSVRKFLEVKLRAWRRIGEILTSAKVDRLTCDSDADYIRKIRAYFRDSPEGPVIDKLNDSTFRTALKAVRVKEQFFDTNAQKYQSIESIVAAFAGFERQEWLKTPEGKAHIKEQEERAALWEADHAKTLRDKDAKERMAREEEQENAAELAALKAARDLAFNEVGITLDRRDRKRMVPTVFLLKQELHDLLRKAAYDNRMTMQSILRSGMLMWLVAHGYPVPPEEFTSPQQGRTKDLHRNG